MGKSEEGVGSVFSGVANQYMQVRLGWAEYPADYSNPDIRSDNRIKQFVTKFLITKQVGPYACQTVQTSICMSVCTSVCTSVNL